MKCVKDGQCLTIPDLKSKTKVGTGCGGCMPLVGVLLNILPEYFIEYCRFQVTSIFNAEMKKAGRTLNNNICPHFSMSRTDLFNVIKVKQLRTFPEIMQTIGINKDSLGCEICKPAIGSILSSLLVPSHLLSPIVVV